MSPQNTSGSGSDPVALGVGVGGTTVPLVCTVSSHSEYPYGVARVVPYIRTYRPVPLTVSVWVPPVPVVVLAMVVQAEASGETWIWNAVAYAVSQASTTWSIVAVAPRSTWIHWGSLNWLDQRVPGLPSVAVPAAVPASTGVG